MTLSLPAESAFLAQPLIAVPAAGRRLVSGRLELEFAAAPDGCTYLRRQYASYPFHVCGVQFQDRDIPDLATLYLQSCSGGLYEDDRLHLALAVGEDAKAHVSTQAATVVHSMPVGRAEQLVRVDCAHGSYLEYLPDPQVLFPGSSCRSAISVRLSGNGVGVVSDSFLQHDPDGKDGTFLAYASEIVVETAEGEVLAIDRLRIEGWAFQGRRPGVSGSFAAQGTLVVAGLQVPVRAVSDALRTVGLDDAEFVIGSSQLPKSAGILVRVLAVDGAALKRAMHMTWCAARLALQGSLPVERRK